MEAAIDKPLNFHSALVQASELGAEVERLQHVIEGLKTRISYLKEGSYLESANV